MFKLVCALALAVCAGCPTFGNVGYHSGPPPLSVSAPGYPSFAPVPGQKNMGFVNGTGFLLLDDGIISTEAGFFDVTMSVVLFGDEAVLSPVEFNLFAIVDGQFSPEDTNLVGASNTVSPGQVVQFQGSNFVYLDRGQRLSVIINNGNGEDPVNVNMFAWGLVLRQMC